MPTFTDTQVDAVTIAAILGQGHTEYRGKPEYAGRYVVGGLATEVFPSGSANVRHRVDYLLGGQEAASAETLGVWVENGNVYIDLGDTYTAESMALQVAAQRGELAIWDRMTETVIYVS